MIVMCFKLLPPGHTLTNRPPTPTHPNLPRSSEVPRSAPGVETLCMQLRRSWEPARWEFSSEAFSTDVTLSCCWWHFHTSSRSLTVTAEINKQVCRFHISEQNRSTTGRPPVSNHGDSVSSKYTSVKWQLSRKMCLPDKKHCGYNMHSQALGWGICQDVSQMDH